MPITEKLSLALRYGLNYDEVGRNETAYFSDPEGTGSLPAACDPFIAGRYVCDVIGRRLSSSIGYSLVWGALDNRLRPSSGERVDPSQDFAGLGGDARYLRTAIEAANHWNVWNDSIFSTNAEGGYIHSFDVEPVRLTDGFFLGSPQVRGFDMRGVGPRIQSAHYLFDDTTGGGADIAASDDPKALSDDAIGGRTYYLARAELEIPLGSGVRELGLRPSIYIDGGALWAVRDPELAETGSSNLTVRDPCTIDSGSGSAANACGREAGTAADTATDFRERFVGTAPSPRLSIGFGVNWNSPFGPFRIDIARALGSEPADDVPIIGSAITKPGSSS